MKKFLLAPILFAVIMLVTAPVVKAQNYTGPVYKSQIPVNEESGGVDIEHHSVHWGGKWLSWAYRFYFHAQDYYHSSNPRVVVTRTTKTYHIVGK